MSTWLHYVGGLYTPEKFIKEAKRIGISRRIPLRNLKSLQWGDEVLCAEWKPWTAVTYAGGETKEHSAGFKSGDARIFCSFIIRHVFVENPEVNKALQEILRAQGKITDYLPQPIGGGRVERECGVYYTGGEILTSASISEIYQILQSLDPKTKVMIGGELKSVYDPPVVVSGVPFTRTLLQIEKKETDLGEGIVVMVIEHKIARTKKERERLE